MIDLKNLTFKQRVDIERAIEFMKFSIQPVALEDADAMAEVKEDATVEHAFAISGFLLRLLKLLRRLIIFLIIPRFLNG